MTDIFAGYYLEDQVLTGVSLATRRGTISAVLGPNGSGKSTALRVLCGLLVPRSGSVLLEGEDITDSPVHDRIGMGIGFLPQGRSIFPSLTVLENLDLGTWIIRRDRSRRKDAIDRVLERYPLLRELRTRPAGALSGGQQRMVEIARMLVADPSLVLIDEPGAGLAPIFVEEVYQEIVRLRDEGRGVLLVDQNVKKAVEIADYVYTLELGRNKAEGPPHDFSRDLAGVVRGWLKMR